MKKMATFIKIIILSSIAFVTIALAAGNISQAKNTQQTNEAQISDEETDVIHDNEFDDGETEEEMLKRLAEEKQIKSKVKHSSDVFLKDCKKVRKISLIKNLYSELKGKYKLAETLDKTTMCAQIAKLPKQNWEEFHKNIVYMDFDDKKASSQKEKTEFYKNCIIPENKDITKDSYEFYGKFYNLPDIQDQDAQCIILRDTLYANEFRG